MQPTGRQSSDEASPPSEWLLLMSKVQAEALDRAAVPHPPLGIPVTEEQCAFWRHFGRTVEFLEDLEIDVLEPLSEEWTAVATIAEAVKRRAEARVVWILGPSPCLEYLHGVHDLEQKLSTLAPGARYIFCGPEVPLEVHGRSVQMAEVSCEHWKVYWHEHHWKTETDQAQLFIALNAGTSVREYQRHWKETFLRLPASAWLYITGYNMAEIEDAQNDLKRSRPHEMMMLGPCRSGSLKGYDKVELGVTPIDFPGKTNYGEFLAVIT